MPSNFFLELGKNVATELAAPSGRYPNNTQRREHLSTILTNTLANHLNRPPTTAKDQNFNPTPARGRNYGAVDQDDPEPVSLSGSDCFTLLQKCIDGLDGDERDAFMEQLANMLQSDDDPGTGNVGNGVPPNNKEALDRRRRKGGRDQMPAPAPMAGDRRRRPGMDGAIRGLNTSNFLKRWPDAAKVAFGGTGR